MTSKLTISIKLVKPNLQGDGRGGLRWSGTSDARTTDVLVLDGVSRDDAEAIVKAWREKNPGLPIKASWQGPTEL